jgi:hypothetical protein
LDSGIELCLVDEPDARLQQLCFVVSDHTGGRWAYRYFPGRNRLPQGNEAAARKRGGLPFFILSFPERSRIVFFR